ncbi:MAG: hypothetical protein E7348_00910 [Clostridiales bacterium]|nr:hypothetical protein [Clostridiales bacterium]
MKKKVTNEEVAKFIGEVADQLREEMAHELNVAQSHMWEAEKQLILSLSREQYELYREFAKKRDVYVQLAKKVYQRKYN